MTVTTTANSISYVGNGTTTAFAFPYVFFVPSDLVVTLIITATGVPVVPAPVLNGAATYDYTVSGTVTHGEYASGGTVTFNTAPLSTHTVSIVRAVAPTQTVTLIDNTKFPADTVNTEFDKLTVLAQQALSVTSNVDTTALQIPDNEVGLTVVAVPAASRAGKLLLWDGSGNLSTLDPTSIIGGAVPSGPAGGDLAGTYPNPTVKANVALTGNPTAPTPTAGDNDTSIATTAFVTAAVTAGVAAGPVLQTVMVQSGTQQTGTTIMPYDNTIPQITEGKEFMTLAITPKSATSKLVITVSAMLACNIDGANVSAALFRDAVAPALAATSVYTVLANAYHPLVLVHTMTSGTTSAITFRFRAGPNAAATAVFNGLFGGVAASSIVIQEVAP